MMVARTTRRRIWARARKSEAWLEKMFVDAVAHGELDSIENPALAVSSMLAPCNNIAISRKTGLDYHVLGISDKITGMAFSAGG